MARRTKDAPGRVTPKGGRVTPRAGRALPRGGAATTSSGRVTAASPQPSGRYTAPIPDEYRSSPWWTPAIIVGLFALSVLTILLNYLSLLPASPNNWYLLGGLGGLIAGFIVATRYH